MSVRSTTTCLLALGAGLFLAGCGGDSGGTLGAETDDAGYRDGQRLAKQGRTQEALSAYLKVIEKRGDQSAAESHLEVGLIFKQHIKDPLEAIHHFRKYLEQRPNSQQAPIVRQQIDAAKREFVSTLPGPQVSDSQVTRLGDYERLDRLQRENEQLKEENLKLRGGGEVARPTSSVRFPIREAVGPKSAPAVGPAVEEVSPLLPAPITPRETESPPVQVLPPPASNPRPTPLKPTAPAAVSGRRHTVAAKESLSSIARQYYGTATNAKLQAIVEANRDLLPGGVATPLKAGMVLKIP